MAAAGPADVTGRPAAWRCISRRPRKSEPPIGRWTDGTGWVKLPSCSALRCEVLQRSAPALSLAVPPVCWRA